MAHDPMAHDETCNCVSRRTVLKGAAAAAVGAAVITAAGPAEEAIAAVRKGTDLGPTTAVPVGGGIRVSAGGATLVVTQPKQGVFRAFNAKCTHEGCLVNRAVTNNTISCPCHGAQFDATSGAPTGGPARRPLTNVKVAVAKGRIVVA